MCQAPALGVMPYLKRDITNVSHDLCTGGEEGHATGEKVSDEIFLLMDVVVRHDVLAQRRDEKQSRSLTDTIRKPKVYSPHRDQVSYKVKQHSRQQ